jgi:hypothetical protein
MNAIFNRSSISRTSAVIIIFSIWFGISVPASAFRAEENTSSSVPITPGEENIKKACAKEQILAAEQLGVQNHFFYLLCEGGSGVNDGISYNINGIGVSNAAQVACRTLTVYCGQDTDHAAARAA